MKNIMATLEAVTKTANEVKELLAKSLPPPPAPMAKDDDQVPPGQEFPPAAPEGQEAPAAAPEQAPEGQVEAEGVDEMAQEIAAMSDEELDMLLQALAGEMEKRQAAQAPAPEAQPAPQAEAPATSPELDAMKSENMAMRKSIQAMNASIESLKKSLAKPAPATRPASMNKPTQVLNKSVKEPELLSKSEVIEHLETLRKSGNRKIDTDLMWTANYAQSDEEMKGVYHAAKLKGIEIPTK
jgi:hypothetical protein